MKFLEFLESLNTLGSPVSIVRRKTSDIKVPGAFITHNPTAAAKTLTLEEHSREIEAEGQLWTDSTRLQQPLAPLRDHLRVSQSN